MKREASLALAIVLLLSILDSCLVVSSKPAESGSVFSVSHSTTSAVDWWPMYQHDLNHTGYSTSTGPSTNKTLWKSENIGSSTYVDQGPTVLDGLLYVSLEYLNRSSGIDSYKVYCLNASSGAMLWSYDLGSLGADDTSPTVADGLVYVAGDFGLYCLDAYTGVKIWNYTTGNGYVYQSSPMVDSGMVYVGSTDGNVYCLSAYTGAKDWNYTVGETQAGGYTSYAYSSPDVAYGSVYVGTTSGNIFCLNAETGAKIWNHTTGGGAARGCSIFDGMAYVGLNPTIDCLNASTGAEVWSYVVPTRNNIQVGNTAPCSCPAIADGKVYVSSEAPDFCCLDAYTGSKIWNFTIPMKYPGSYLGLYSPAVADGKVYITQDTFYCLNASTGEKIWSSDDISSDVAIVNGILYGANSVCAIGSSVAGMQSVSFKESGLPYDTSWWVDLNGENRSSTTDTIVFSVLEGTYSYSVGAAGYNASDATGFLTVSGSDMNKPESFISEYSPLILPALLSSTTLVVAITMLRKRNLKKEVHLAN